MDLKEALAKYGRTIQKHGWKAGEHLILNGEKQFPDFRKWALALAIMLRAEELLR